MKNPSISTRSPTVVGDMVVPVSSQGLFREAFGDSSLESALHDLDRRWLVSVEDFQQFDRAGRDFLGGQLLELRFQLVVQGAEPGDAVLAKGIAEPDLCEERGFLHDAVELGRVGRRQELGKHVDVAVGVFRVFEEENNRLLKAEFGVLGIEAAVRFEDDVDDLVLLVEQRHPFLQNAARNVADLGDDCGQGRQGLHVGQPQGDTLT